MLSPAIVILPLVCGNGLSFLGGGVHGAALFHDSTRCNPFLALKVYLVAKVV